MVFSSNIHCLPLVLMLFSAAIIWMGSWVILTELTNSLYVHQQRVIIPEFNRININDKLLNVKYNFASVPVLDLADTVFNINSLRTKQSFSILVYFYGVIKNIDWLALPLMTGSLIPGFHHQLGWELFHPHHWYTATLPGLHPSLQAALIFRPLAHYIINFITQ